MKKIVSLLLTVILMFSCACAESATASLQEMYAQGELMMVQGDYMGAAAQFDALGTYSDASQMAMYCKAIAAAENFGLYEMAVDAFIDLGDFKDSRQMAQYYEGRAYEAAGMIDVATATDGDLNRALKQLEEAEKVYSGLAFFKDSLTRFGACDNKIKEIKDEQSRRAQIERDQELARMEAVYQDALALEQNGDYARAIKLYRSLNGYKDSVERIAICETAILDEKYDAAVVLMEEGKYSEAIEVFEEIKYHKDSAEKIKECETAIFDEKYDAAVVLMEEGKYSEAIAAFEGIKNHRDSAEKIKECETAILDEKYDAAVALMEEGKYSEAIAAFEEIKNHRDSATKIKECETAILDEKYDAAVALMEEGKYSEAIAVFTEIVPHRDSADMIILCQYNAAVALMEAGKYSAAISAFEAIKDYKDSAAKIKECETVIFSSATVGTYITFGSYEQDNNTANGKEAIEWLVLAEENGCLFVISRYALDCKPYNAQSADITWKTCTLRRWLNNDFLNAAFSSAEQAMIPVWTVSADKNPSFSTDPGKATQDKVFLLSINEANRYFKSDSVRQCQPTDYAEAQGVSTYGGGCWWWLRSPGYQQNYAADVFYDGEVGTGGFNVGWSRGWNDNSAVRPAMWIKLAP